MPAYHMLLHCPSRRDARRIDFHAEGPDHAFQIARNEADGTEVELWEGNKLLVRMAKTVSNVWQILPSGDTHPMATQQNNGMAAAD